MRDPSEERDRADQKRDPLVPIGLIVLALMLVPILLYSMVPDGPVKEGDLVFSTGRHRVPLIEPRPDSGLGQQAFCVIEPREQLMILRRLPGEPDRTIVAQPITPVRRGAPFCPPKAEVLLRPHQASLKIDVWGAVRDTVVNVFAQQ